jgi:hypothetical protein
MSKYHAYSLVQHTSGCYVQRTGLALLGLHYSQPPYEVRVRGTSQVRCGVLENDRRAPASSSTALSVPQERAPVCTVPQAAKGVADCSPRLARVHKRYVKADSRTPASP